MTSARQIECRDGRTVSTRLAYLARDIDNLAAAQNATAAISAKIEPKGKQILSTGTETFTQCELQNLVVRDLP